MRDVQATAGGGDHGARSALGVYLHRLRREIGAMDGPDVLVFTGGIGPGHSFIGPEAVVEGVFARIPATFGDTFRIEINRLLDSVPGVHRHAAVRGGHR